MTNRPSGLYVGKFDNAKTAEDRVATLRQRAVIASSLTEQQVSNAWWGSITCCKLRLAQVFGYERWDGQRISLLQSRLMSGCVPGSSVMDSVSCCLSDMPFSSEMYPYMLYRPWW